MGFVVVIPARFASSRLPGKPLLDIAGKPMIQHVWERACQSGADEVYIATDHAEIKKVAEAFGAKVCMTKDTHESGTDRLQEVVGLLGLKDDQVLVNVQGDEPLIPAAVIDQVAALMHSAETQMATLFEVITDEKQVFDPNAVKLVADDLGNALYFSRAPIPWYRDGFTQSQQLPSDVTYKRHIGIYAYRAALLNRFVHWPVSSLEAVEKLEQLRAMSNGIRIRVEAACEKIPAGVDTQHDLDVVRALLAKA